MFVIQLSVACSDSPSPPSTPQLPIRSLVTGAAAAGLTAAGKFKLGGPPADATAQISRARAEELAAIWPGQFGVWIRPRLEREHGAAVDLANLRVCGETVYAESPYEPVEATLARKLAVGVYRRVFGPWWITQLCGVQGKPEVILAISAYASDLSIEGGKIQMPSVGGEWFAHEGIPRSLQVPLLPSAELAAVETAKRTGRRVAEVPQLVIPSRPDGFPYHARWRIVLEDVAAATRIKDGSRKESREFYFGRRPAQPSAGFEIPSDTQPDQVTVQYRDDLVLGLPVPEIPRYAQLSVRRRSSLMTAFEKVTLEDSAR
jgi:hypothetical protein